MAIDLDLLTEASRAVLTTLAEQERDARIQEEQAQTLVLWWRSQIEALAEKRRVIEESQRIHEEMFKVGQSHSQPEAPARIVSAEPKKRRARIGPQRFWVLQTLQAHVSADIVSLAKYAGVELKRVKDLVRSDVPEGIIEEIGQDHPLFDPLGSETQYTLSAEGGDLLDRFKAYKKAKGEPLPSREDAGRDEADSENTEADEKDTGQVPSSASGEPVTEVIDWNDPKLAREEL